MSDRSIIFEKIQNVRDLGGIVNKNGKAVRSGCLIRSANLSSAAKKDAEVLQENYHLSKIIDLRTDTEKREQPDIDVLGADYFHIPVFDEAVAGISYEKSNDILKSLPKLDDLYFKMFSDDNCLKNFGKSARLVMENDYSKGSVLWHCTEGKDRCGLLSAVLLMALDVDRKQITEDYLLTNETNGAKAQKYAQMLLAMGKTEQEAQLVCDMLLAKESYLNSAFKAVDSRFADEYDFLINGLSIPAETLTAFKSSILI